MLNIKKDYEYNANVKDVFKLISYKAHKPIVKGSNSMRFKYGSDYDLFSVVKTHENLDKLKKDVVKEFKDMMYRIRSHSDYIYFLYFKCGKDKDGKGIKWTMNEVIKGKKGNIKLIDNLEGIIKIEIIAYMDGVFMPYSDVFEIYNNGKGLNQEKVTIDNVESLEKDIEKYKKENNLMKVFKRMFIIADVEKNVKRREQFIQIFESDIGKLYKVKSDLGNMKSVLEIYKDKITFERCADQLQKLKETLANQTAFHFPLKIYRKFDVASRKKSSKSMNKDIEFLENNILKVVNKLLEKQAQKLRITF